MYWVSDSVTSLDHIETKSHFQIERKVRIYTETHEQLGQIFRHRKVGDKRDRVLQCLVSSGVSQSRISRFRECGSQSYLYRSVFDEKKYRIKCFKCHDRFCTQCAFERGRLYARSIEQFIVQGRTRFVTVTLCHSSKPLNEQLTRLYSCYSKLRRRKLWSVSQEASIAFTEITYNLEKQQFHCHLHILSIGSFIDQKKLSEDWKSITKDSFIVDVRIVQSTRKAAQYVAKYASKGISGFTLLNQSRAIEVINALSHRRLIIKSGNFKNLQPVKITVDPEEWIPICPLGHWIEDVLQGVPEALEILECLKIRKEEVLKCQTSIDMNSG